ncbi:protein of unknown function [Aminobacter niigataensis]|nr:protein of unknown function [Aminobacter niigataensis]
MERHSQNGAKIARWLEGRKDVRRVLDQALHPAQALGQRERAAINVVGGNDMRAAIHQFAPRADRPVAGAFAATADDRQPARPRLARTAGDRSDGGKPGPLPLVGRG